MAQKEKSVIDTGNNIINNRPDSVLCFTWRDMEESIIIAIIGAIPGVIALLLRFVEHKPESHKKEADAASSLVGTSLEIVDEFKQRIMELEKKLDAANKRIKELEAERERSDKRIQQLEHGLKLLTKQVKEMGQKPVFEVNE